MPVEDRIEQLARLVLVTNWGSCVPELRRLAAA